MSVSELFKQAKYRGEVLGVVTNSVEFQRISALPRRVLDLDDVQDVTPLFVKSGLHSFWPIQSAALIEAAMANGLFGMIAVGKGKELICLALPTAMDSENTVLLVKAGLKKQVLREAETFYNKHFNLPLDIITVLSYNDLSSKPQHDILERINPDLVIANEAHCLSRMESARTKRFHGFMRESAKTRFCALSGTMTTRSITDYNDLIELALRKLSPVPDGYREVNDWAGALDVKPAYCMQPGVLMRWCDEGESVQDGYRRRLVQSLGVVASGEDELGVSLVIRKLTPTIPPEMKKILAHVESTWELDDIQYATALDMARLRKQLACGFYYRWVWPDDEPNYAWLEARSNWNAEVAQKLKYATKGLDSESFLEEAAERYRLWEEAGRPRPKPKKAWDSGMWAAWREMKYIPEPPKEAVWKHDFLVKEALAWVKKHPERSIIWTSWTAVGKRIAQKGKLPFYGAGTDASEATAPVIVATIQSQGTGKNLQHQYSNNLILVVPPNGKILEQLLGREHRHGQPKDEVLYEWFGHTKELEDSMAAAIDDAEYIERTTGQRQKVLYATRINE